MEWTIAVLELERRLREEMETMRSEMDAKIKFQEHEIEDLRERLERETMFVSTVLCPELNNILNNIQNMILGKKD